MLGKFLTEELDPADNRTGRGISQGAERLTGKIVADIEQQIEVFLLTPAMFKAVQDLGQPVGALAAGRTFAARLVAIELGHTQDRAHDAGIFAYDDDSAGARHRASRGY